MKKLQVIGVVMLCLLVFSPSGAEILDKARLSFVQDDVLMQNEKTGADWVSAPINMPLTSGDSLWVTEGSKAEVHFLGGVFLRADEETRLTMLNLESGAHSIDVSLDKGRVYANYTDTSSRAQSMQIYTPALTATISEPSRFNVDVYDDGYIEIIVLEGAISVEGQFGNTRVHAGSRFSTGNSEVAELSPFSKKPKDSWGRWNLARDSLYAESSESVRYLPDELHDFSRDFDDNGHWVYLSDYGYAWTPTVVASGWAPYQRGRWAWLRNDYVWVSYESWGWAPHHYGRWVFRSGIGWCWIPPVIKAVFWSPGFVAWIHTPAYVSWVPLAPREIYYGHGYFGPHSINIINVNINKIKITNVYRNVRVRHAVTIVHKNTFLTGKHTKRVKAPLNPFLTKKKLISVGRPHIKPLKKTYSPLPRKLVKKRYRNEKHIINKQLNKRNYSAYNKRRHQESERSYAKKVAKRKYYDRQRYNAPRKGHNNGDYSIHAKREQSGLRKRAEIKKNSSTRQPVRNYYQGKRKAGKSKHDFKKPGAKKKQTEIASSKDFDQNGKKWNYGGSVKEHHSRFQKHRERLK